LETIKVDCTQYINPIRCKVLKEMLCKKGECPFYQQGAIKRENIVIPEYIQKRAYRKGGI